MLVFQLIFINFRERTTWAITSLNTQIWSSPCITTQQDFYAVNYSERVSLFFVRYALILTAPSAHCRCALLLPSPIILTGKFP